MYGYYNYSYGVPGMGAIFAMSAGMWIVMLAFMVASLVGEWKIFEKTGREGWKAIIPFYNSYTLFDIVYGDGIKFLFLLIPFYNIYVMIKLYLDLAKLFGQETAFGWGLILLNPVFMCILGFGPARFNGGTASYSGSSNATQTHRQTITRSDNKTLH